MLNLSHKKAKRGLQQLSDTQKLEAIAKVDKGETKAAVAREFGIPESTLRGWCKKAKLNNHHSASAAVMNKSMHVQTMPPIFVGNEMAYRDCGYSKGSGSDEGSVHRFGDQEDEDQDYILHHRKTGAEDDNQILWNWISQHHHNHYPNSKLAEEHLASFFRTPDNTAGSLYSLRPPHGWFYSWCKMNVKKEDTATSISPSPPTPPTPPSPVPSFNEEEPLALVVQSKRRIVEEGLNNHQIKSFNHQISNI